ncbi:MAG: YdcF family protein [Clostridia bacterium]|nr:YdcF family protein [Clostridia bacterium]
MKKIKRYDLILLLGLRLGPGGEISQELEARISLAAELWREGVAPYIVVSGGDTGTGVTEASVMKDTLITADILAEAILCETASTTTYENLRNVKQMPEIGCLQLKKRRISICLVTSDYHVSRARLIARSLGFRASAYGADVHSLVDEREKRRLERLYTLNYLMGWETGRRKRPLWYDAAVRKLK